MLDYKIIVLLFSTSVNVLMAIFVLLKDHKKIVNIAYAFFSINVSLWALTNAIFQITNSYEIAFLSSLLSYISAIIGVASLLYLIIFLNNKPLNIFKKYYPAITTLLGIIFVLIPNFVLTDVNIIEKKRFLVTNWGLYLFAICISALILNICYKLIINYKKNDGSKKIQFKYTILGFTSMLFAGMFFNLILPILGIYNLVWLGPNFSVITVIAIGYAIVRYRFLGIKVLYSRAYKYFLISIFLYFLIILTFIYSNSYSISNSRAYALGFAIAILCAIIIVPLINAIQKSSDTIFYKSKNPQKITKDLIINLSTIVNTEKIIKTIKQEFQKILKTKDIHIILFTPHADFQTKYLSAIKQLKIRKKSKQISHLLLDKSERLLCNKMAKNKELIVRDEIQKKDELAKELDKHQIKIIAPLVSRNKVIGTLILNEKKTKEAYAQEEIFFLQEICSQIAIAIENSLLHKELNKKVADQTAKITHQNKEIIIQNRQLHKLLNSKSDFIKIVSHQLRTPVSVIKSVLNMMKGAEDLKNKEELMQGVYVKSMKISEIIDEMIYAFDLEAETFNANQKAINIIEVVEAAISNPKRIAQESNIKFNVNFTNKKLLPVFASAEHLEKAISVLANNAVTYNKKNGSVEIKITQNKKQTKITVSDTGYGLSPKYIKNIFQPFTRDINANEFDTDKSGLGLYIAKKIINAHKDANIKLINTSQQGTTFEIILPTLTKEYMIRR